MDKLLFSPFTLNSLVLANRIVMSPMTRGASPHGIPTAEVARYYAARAAGGVGLITTEAIAVDRPYSANNQGIPNLHHPEAIAGWRAVVDAVHAKGGRIFAQLWHCGKQQPMDPLFAEGIPHEGPENMSARDVENTIVAFGQAARRAKEVGFDGVEIHGANGYLVDQFLWAKTNTRTDQWGGSVANRVAFPAALVKEIKRQAGSDYPLSFRFSQFKLSDYQGKLAHTPQELEQVLQPLADAGVDIFHASQRRFWIPEFDGSTLNLAGWAKKLTGKIATSVGSVGLEGPDTGDLLAHTGGSAQVGSLEQVEERLAKGEFDLIAVGRALLTDAEWANKVREGRLAELKGFEVQSLHSLVGA